jgi:hypothetical protein
MKASIIEVTRVAALIGLASVALQADPVNVIFSPIYVSIGPNPNTSPSYGGYTANAQAGVAARGQNEGGTILPGQVGSSPTAFNLIGGVNRIPTISESDIIGTSFPSWLGWANPATPFNNETGNYLYFSIEITSTSPALNNISLSNIFYAQKSNDLFDTFSSPKTANDNLVSFAGQNYGPDAVGIFVNGSTTTTGEAGTDLVNAIILTGVAIDLPIPAGLTGSDPEILAQAASVYNNSLSDFSIFTCFDYGGFQNDYELDGIGTRCDSSLSTVNVIPEPPVFVPEPSAIPFLGVVLLLAPLAIRRLRIAQ